MRSLRVFDSIFRRAYWMESSSISGNVEYVQNREGGHLSKNISYGPVAMNVQSGFILQDNSGYMADAPVPLRERNSDH
jgi:hypothetical protein